MAERIGQTEALLLAFDQAADYDSPNFLWFRERFPRFVYVDRIVVAGEARGRGHPAVSTSYCSNGLARPGTSGSSARSIPTRPIRPRTRFMRTWALSR